MAFEKLPKHVVQAPPEPSRAATWLCVGLLSLAALAFVIVSRPSATTPAASIESIAPPSTAAATPAVVTAITAPAPEKNTTATSAAAPSDSALVDSNNRPADEPLPPPPPSRAVEAAQSVPEPAVSLLLGSFTHENNALVYDEDALVLLSDGGLLSSPNGVMVSDEKQKLFVGDLTLETGEHTMVGTDAVLDLEQGRMSGKNMTVTFAPLKGSVKNPSGGPTTVITENQNAQK